MLPNWLYGKSKSKLASILGGGGGTPADYDQVKAQVTQNAEDILSLSDALDDKAALTQITNPNLLINPWFTVNQRGFTTGSISPNPYVADRWKVIGTTTVVATNDTNGITIETNANDDAILQTTLAPNISKSLLGRELTMSLSKTIGEVDSFRTFTMPDSFPESTTTYFSQETEDYKLTAVVGSDGYVKIRVQVKEVKVVTIRAIKLEIGNVSTLARDSSPDMATELAKCQRYFQRISGDANSIIDWGFSSSNNLVRYCIHIKEMRAKPTMTYSNVICGSTAPSSFTLAGYTSGRVQVNATVSEASTANVNYRLLLASGGYIDFSADL